LLSPEFEAIALRNGTVGRNCVCVKSQNARENSAPLKAKGAAPRIVTSVNVPATRGSHTPRYR
jgi:hypothetical protein